MSIGEGRDGKLRIAMAKGGLSGKLAGKSLPRQIMLIALWPLLEQLLSFVCTSVSYRIAGHLEGLEDRSADVLSAIGVTGFILWLGFLIQAGVATGATALVSRLTGAREFEKAQVAANQAAVLGAVAGVLSTVVMLVSSPFLLGSVLELSDQAYEYAMEYMNVAAWVAVFSGAVFALNAALRGSGDTKTPFMIMLLVDGLAIVVSYVLAVVWGWNIVGLAWGMVIPWMLGACVLLLAMLRRGVRLRRSLAGEALDSYAEKQGREYAPQLSMSLPAMRPNWGLQRRIIDVGLPQALEVGGIWAIQFYGLRLITSLGTVATGAHSVAIRVESMSFLPGFAIGIAGSALVGQYIGSGNIRLAFETMRRCMFFAVALMGTMGILFGIFAESFVGFFAGNSAEIVAGAVPLMYVFMVGEPVLAMVMVCRMCLRGAGDTKRVMMITFIGMGFFRVGVLSLWHYCWPETMTLVGVWALYIFDLAVQALILSRVVVGLRWARKKV